VAGFNGSCQFPQITREGLDDSLQHGKDLYGVYHDMLGFLPDAINEKTTWRVSNNVITSQVAGMLIEGSFRRTLSGILMQGVIPFCWNVLKVLQEVL
jgi:acid phosphatase